MPFFPNITVTVRRYDIATGPGDDGGHYELGRWVQGVQASADFTIQISKQPATGEEMQTYAEGRRVKAMYKCFSSVLVYTTDPHNLQTPNVVGSIRDEIIDSGEVYEVAAVSNWKNGILPHYEFFILKEKEIEAQ